MNSTVTIHPYSLATTRFKAIREEVSCPGTGFIIRQDTNFFLVTALHMLTGRHWETRKPISEQGMLPEKFSLSLPYYKFFPPNQHVLTWSNHVIVPLKINHGASEEVAPWLVHPSHRENIDVAVLPLWDTPVKMLQELKENGKADSSSEVYAFDWGNEPRVKTSVGDDVFVIGFPGNISVTGEFPIWKRGSVATEPDLPIGNLPYVLVDTGTRSGMSGSPVVRRQYPHIRKVNASDFVLYDQIDELFGIYSGRFGADDHHSQLGIVWKASVISEILAQPTLGKSTLCTWLW